MIYEYWMFVFNDNTDRHLDFWIDVYDNKYSYRLGLHRHHIDNMGILRQ